MKRNIWTGETTIPGMIDGTTPPLESQLRAAGWREEPEQPPVADGYERTNLRLVEGDGVTGRWEYTDTLISDRLAAEAAANRARMIAELTPARLALAQAYRVALRAIAGPNAETNRDVTRDAVVAAMLSAPAGQYDARAADLFKLAFEELAPIVGANPPNTWDLPWDVIPE